MSATLDDFDDAATSKLHLRRGSRISPDEKRRRKTILAKRKLAREKLKHQRREKPAWKKRQSYENRT